MPNNEEDKDFARKLGGLLTRISKVVEDTKRKICYQPQKKSQQNKQWETTVQAQEGMLISSFVCAKDSGGNLFTHVLKFTIDHDAKEELSCQLNRKKVARNSSQEIWSCGVNVSSVLPFYALISKMKNVRAKNKGVTNSPNQKRLYVYSPTSTPHSEISTIF